MEVIGQVHYLSLDEKSLIPNGQEIRWAPNPPPPLPETFEKENTSVLAQI